MIGDIFFFFLVSFRFFSAIWDHFICLDVDWNDWLSKSSRSIDIDKINNNNIDNLSSIFYSTSNNKILGVYFMYIQTNPHTHTVKPSKTWINIDRSPNCLATFFGWHSHTHTHTRTECIIILIWSENFFLLHLICSEKNIINRPSL